MIKTVSFLQSFKTKEQAEEHAKTLIGKSIILHIYDDETEGGLFALCGDVGVNLILETLRDSNPR